MGSQTGNTHTCKARPNRLVICHVRAFTLIELLVVIAIIALLVGILMPSLARAKELARIAVCLGNLKSLASACMLYVGDNDGKIAATPAGKTTTFQFTDNTGAAQTLARTWRKTNKGDAYTDAAAWSAYGYNCVMRAYGVAKDGQRCPSDQSPYGGNWYIESWAWSAADQTKILSDPGFYSSYCATNELWTMGGERLWGGDPNVERRMSPTGTFVALETTQPELGPSENDYYSSIHGKTRRYAIDGSGEFAKGAAALLDGHASLFTWDTLLYSTGDEYYPWGSALGIPPSFFLPSIR